MDKGLEQLQAWVLSTYQRLERMDVPVFDTTGAARMRKLERVVEDAEVVLLPTALPHEASAELDSTTALALMLRYLAAPLRYEPAAESALHKAVPSARCMYPVAYAVLLREAGVVNAYLYVPEFHGLRPVTGMDLSLPDGVDVAIAAFARVWRIAEKYGEFADFPCVLEAGHGLAQLGHLSAMLGLHSAALLDRELARTLCRDELELPLFAMNTGLGAVALDGLPVRQVRLAGKRAGTGLDQLFPRLPRLHSLFDRGASSPGRAAQAPSSVSLAGMRRRNAGNDRSGVAAVFAQRPLGAHSLLAAWQQTRAGRSGMATEASLRLQLAWIAPGQLPAGLYGVDGQCHTGGMPRAEFLRRLHQMLPYRGMRYNLSTLAAVLVIQADPVEAVAVHGDSALRDMHLAAGAAAQDFCLAAAEQGMFARPVRMMRESTLETVLPLQGQVMYLVLCGYGRRSNLTMGLL